MIGKCFLGDGDLHLSFPTKDPNGSENCILEVLSVENRRCPLWHYSVCIILSWVWPVAIIAHAGRSRKTKWGLAVCFLVLA